MYEEKIMPVEESLHEDEFTGRVEILRKLENWVKEIGRVGASSTSIIAPRRMGKTVLLDRLVNRIFFKPEYKVAPFYIKFKREETTLKQFLKEYALTFFRQYIAYCIQDPVLYNRGYIKPEKLLNIDSAHKGVRYAQEYLEQFIERYNENDTGGFTQELLDEVSNRKDVYYSDYEGINNIFRTYGYLIMREITRYNKK